MFTRSLVLILSLLIAPFAISTYSTDAQAAKRAPAFTLKDLKGKRYTLKDFRKNVVYLDFWASWCKPCQKSFPWMNKMQRKYKNKGFRVVAVNLDDDKDLVKDFLKRNRAKFKVLLDPNGKAAEKYNVIAMPSSYLIDRKGRIRKIHHGFLEKDQNKKEKEIKKLL